MEIIENPISKYKLKLKKINNTTIIDDKTTFNNAITI